MRSVPIVEIGAFRHNPGRIDVGVHNMVVLLDLYKINGVAEARRLEQIPGIGPQHRHLRQLLSIAFEVAMVDGVEAGQRGEQPDIGLGDAVANEIALIRQSVRQPVESGEQPVVGRIVGPL